MKILIAIFFALLYGCSENDTSVSTTNLQSQSVEKSCTYEESYIDQQTTEYIAATNAFITATRTQSNSQGLANIQGFSIYTEAYQNFSHKHNVAGQIVNAEICKEQVKDLMTAINRANEFIRSEKGKITF